MKDEKKVLIVLGSESDRERIAKLPKVLEWFGIQFEIVISSAHRDHAKTVKIAENARLEGIKVIIAAAGMAAHLPGVLAALTPLPVIGIPLDASPLAGQDALYSIVQMPPGVPVATVGINGAFNAAVLAARIIALEDKKMAEKLDKFIENGSRI